MISGEPMIRGELRRFLRSWIRKVVGTRQWRIEFRLVEVFRANYDVLSLDDKLKKSLQKGQFL